MNRLRLERLLIVLLAVLMAIYRFSWLKPTDKSLKVAKLLRNSSKLGIFQYIRVDFGFINCDLVVCGY